MNEQTVSAPHNFWATRKKQSNQVERYFYRCPHCLIVAALDFQPTPYAECDTCRDGERVSHMEFMGRVEQDKSVREYDRPICDDRCTSARGPSCNCKCGGQNHGSHLWITVRIVNDIPVVPAPKDADKYRANAKAFENAIAQAKQKMVSVVGADTVSAIEDRRWVNNKDLWLKHHYFWKTINKARAMREHKARLKAVDKAIKGLSWEGGAI